MGERTSLVNFLHNGGIIFGDDSSSELPSIFWVLRKCFLKVSL
jgi:hypothetical protein